MIYLVTLLTIILFIAIAMLIHQVVKAKQLEVENRDLAKRLEEKQHLLSVLFHDLSNSTTLLSLLSDSSILEMKDKEGILQNLGRVSGVIENMSELIQHIRKIQSIESGKSNIKLEPVALKETVDKSIQLIRKRLEKKNQHIRIEANKNNISVMAEPSSLCHSVFTNLITNASKFSPEGSEILVRISQSNSVVNVEITDQGIGIPESMIKSLFSFTNETHREGTHGEEGSGFGLPVVEKYMKFYGGNIKAKNNRDGIGSTFSLSFVNSAYMNHHIPNQASLKLIKRKDKQKILEINH